MKNTLSSNQIIDCCCKHCGNKDIKDTEFFSGSYETYNTFQCTCEHSGNVAHYRQELHKAKAFLEEQQTLLDGFLSVEAREFTDKRVEQQVEDILKESGYTVEQLREIFKMSK